MRTNVPSSFHDAGEKSHGSRGRRGSSGACIDGLVPGDGGGLGASAGRGLIEASRPDTGPIAE